ncbi:MAG TPA: flagellar basal body-associated FliL family protein [Albitalea sp.]|nr:flagellar basal body-associated FliL family protein [Albitalea sp.]
MATSSRPPAPPSAPNDTRRVALILLGIALAIVIPVSIVGGIDWLDLPSTWSGAGRPLPKWVTAGEVRATTRDGTLVKMRVAFDVGSSATKSLIENQLRDVALLLEVSVSAQSTRELAGPGGIDRLSKDMLQRVNGYLAEQGATPLRAVAIQDLWYTRP